MMKKGSKTAGIKARGEPPSKRAEGSSKKRLRTQGRESAPSPARHKQPAKRRKAGVKRLKRGPAGRVAAIPIREEKTSLPHSYNETKLVLLPRDPYWIYAYWDLSGATWNWIQNLLHGDQGMRALLRIYNLTAADFFDVSVDLTSKNWYLNPDCPNTEFEAELGLLGSNGFFHVIVKSNRIRTPRNAPSEVIDPAWDPVHFDEIYRLSGGGRTGAGSSPFPSSRFLIP